MFIMVILSILIAWHSICSSVGRSGTVSNIIVLCIRKARPPPVSFFLSFLKRVKSPKSASLDLSVSLVSCKAATLMLCSFSQRSNSVCLFLMPLQLYCKIFRLNFLGSGWLFGGVGLVGEGLVGEGLVGKGLVGKGLVGKGLVGKGLVGKGLVGKGLVGKGLVGKGLVGKGLVVVRLVQVGHEYWMVYLFKDLSLQQLIPVLRK